MLRGMRAEGRYRELESFLLPEQRSAVIALLQAADHLVRANDLLQRRLRRNLGLAVAQDVNFEKVANIVGVFSRDVTLLSEEIVEPQATVTFQIGDQIPLETAALRRDGDRWILIADPIAGVPECVDDLAGVLDRMADLVERRPFTVDELRHEIQLRQAPILRKLQRLIDEAESNAERSPTPGPPSR